MQSTWVLDEILWGAGAPSAEVTAIVEGDRRVSFGELSSRAGAIRASLEAAGVGIGDRIAILTRRAAPILDVVLGAAASRVVTVPINWRLAPPEVAAIVVDAAARTVFVDPEYVDLVTAALDGVGMASRPLVVVLGDVKVGSKPEWAPPAESRPEDVVLQMYTSGTTGIPKGVMLTNRNLAGMVSLGQHLGIGRESVTFAGLPLFHIGGLGWVLMALATGASTVLLPEFDGDAAVAALANHRVTQAILVPAMLQEVCASLEDRPTELDSLELMVYGASPISEDLLRRSMTSLGCDFCQWYGMTETTGAVTELPPHDHVGDGRLLRSAGRALPGVELRVVDSEGAPVPDGTAGELMVRSAQVTQGYWNNPEASAAVISSDGWLRTGDAGYLQDGYLFLCDRIKDMIISGGENVYPVEVENALMSHPAVVEVAVFGIPSTKWGEEVAAAVVTRSSSEVSADELRAFARSHLAGFKVPKRIEFHDALPRNASGKILRRLLRDPYWAGLDRAVH